MVEKQKQETTAVAVVVVKYEDQLRTLWPDPVYGDDGTRIAVSNFVKVTLVERDALADAIAAIRLAEKQYQHIEREAAGDFDRDRIIRTCSIGAETIHEILARLDALTTATATQSHPAPDPPGFSGRERTRA